MSTLMLSRNIVATIFVLEKKELQVLEYIVGIIGIYTL